MKQTKREEIIKIVNELFCSPIWRAQWVNKNIYKSFQPRDSQTLEQLKPFFYLFFTILLEMCCDATITDLK